MCPKGRMLRDLANATEIYQKLCIRKMWGWFLEHLWTILFHMSAFFRFKITYADKVSAFLYLRESWKKRVSYVHRYRLDRRPCFQFYWLPPAFAKIARFFFQFFHVSSLVFSLILCCAPFGLDMETEVPMSGSFARPYRPGRVSMNQLLWFFVVLIVWHHH